MVIAAHAKDTACFAAFYDGKIDRPRLYAEALTPDALHGFCEAAMVATDDPRLIGAWNFSVDIPTEIVADMSENRLHGVLRQMPARAMTGANWDAIESYGGPRRKPDARDCAGQDCLRCSFGRSLQFGDELRSWRGCHLNLPLQHGNLGARGVRAYIEDGANGTDRSRRGNYSKRTTGILGNLEAGLTANEVDVPLRR